MIDLIEKWLISKNYEVGCELYKRFGNNIFLANLFFTKKSIYNSVRLEEELKKILLEAKKKTKPKQVLGQSEIKLSELQNAPKEIVQVIKERKFLYMQARDAFSKIKALSNIKNTENEISANAELILNNFDKIKNLWDITNYYDEHHTLPKIKRNDFKDNELEMKAELETFSITELNILWLRNYKYCQDLKNRLNTIEIAMREKYNFKIFQNRVIQKILDPDNAFQYNKFIMPPEYRE